MPAFLSAFICLKKLFSNNHNVRSTSEPRCCSFPKFLILLWPAVAHVLPASSKHTQQAALSPLSLTHPLQKDKTSPAPYRSPTAVQTLLNHLTAQYSSMHTCFDVQMYADVRHYIAIKVESSVK